MSDEIKVVSLNCLSCAAPLQIGRNSQEATCSYCNTPHVVLNSGASVSLRDAISGIEKIYTATDKTAAELALVRLNGELAAHRVKMAIPYTVAVSYRVRVTSDMNREKVKPSKSQRNVGAAFLAMSLFLLWSCYIGDGYISGPFARANALVGGLILLLIGSSLISDGDSNAGERIYKSELRSKEDEIILQIDRAREIVDR